ncbi:adaptor complexes medium subunit family domain-containing protein [Ditylenchus destructor]|uniref:Adaptor complexes medium subunit family domain-containing protein n=1 Tax=Ditylenchus destructor TaxID=166010 RepID=A0AAD4R477_9BILA|nr:adaptor complexes medium subunit family domain-containing protein [Ditylenchus destructor]
MDIESRESLLSPNSCQISAQRNLWNLFSLDVQLEVFRCLRAYDLYKHGINVSRQWRNTIEYHKNTLPKLRRIPTDFREMNRLAGDICLEFRQQQAEKNRKREIAEKEEAQKRLHQKRRMRFQYSAAILLPSIFGYILALVAQRPLSTEKVIATTLLLSITCQMIVTYRKFFRFQSYSRIQIFNRDFYRIRLFNREYGITTVLFAKQLKYIWPAYLVARSLIFGIVGVLQSQHHLRGDQIFYTLLAITHLPEAFYLINDTYTFVRDNSSYVSFFIRFLWTSYTAVCYILAAVFLHLWLPGGITFPVLIINFILVFMGVKLDHLEEIPQLYFDALLRCDWTSHTYYYYCCHVWWSCVKSFPGDMSCSAIFILDLKGNVIMSRNYRGDEDEGRSSPIVQNNDLNYIFIKHTNIFLVSLSKKNANAAMIFSWLYKCVDVFICYFKDLEEESVRDNFVVIYELLDEMSDFGFPQTTEPKILQEYITQETHQLEIAPRPPMAVTNAVSWRSEGIKYRKNEVFLDVIESVNLLANASGTVLRSEIVGSIRMRVILSGMPELRLGLNDKVLFQSVGRSRGKAVELEDVKFHQCVRLSRFESERTISFIPPDGEFELMSYRLSATIKPLIWVEVSVEKHAHSRVEFMVKAKSQFKRQSIANHVEVIVPVPSDADSPKFKSPIGSAKYAPEIGAFVWTIRSFPGGREYLMRAHFSLPSIVSEETQGKIPVSVKFEIPYFTTSGLQVRYLKIIEKSGYQALPWVLVVVLSKSAVNGGNE